MNQPQTLRVLTSTGVQFLAGLSQQDKSLVARHWNAVRRYLEYGETDQLDALDGRTVGGQEFAHLPGIPFGGVALNCDPASIEWHAMLGEVSFESIYDEVT